MFPRLEEDIYHQRVLRLRKDHVQLLSQRLALLKEAYQDFLGRLVASDWAVFPVLSSLDNCPLFRKYVYALEGQSVCKEDFMASLEIQRQQTLRSIQKMSAAMDSSISKFQSRCDIDIHPDLATFDSSRYPDHVKLQDQLIRKVIGNEEYGDYHRSLRKHDLDQTHVQHALKIVELAGLDPKVATAWDMDCLTTEYVCTYSSCNRSAFLIAPPVAYSWRAAVGAFR